MCQVPPALGERGQNGEGRGGGGGEKGVKARRGVGKRSGPAGVGHGLHE